MRNHQGFECPALWKAPSIYGVMDVSIVAAKTRAEAANLLSTFYKTTIYEPSLKRLQGCFYNGQPRILKMFEKEAPESELS